MDAAFVKPKRKAASDASQRLVDSHPLDTRKRSLPAPQISEASSEGNSMQDKRRRVSGHGGNNSAREPSSTSSSNDSSELGLASQHAPELPADVSFADSSVRQEPAAGSVQPSMLSSDADVDSMSDCRGSRGGIAKDYYKVDNGLRTCLVAKCKWSQKVNKTGSTKNFLRHLKNHHGSIARSLGLLDIVPKGQQTLNFGSQEKEQNFVFNPDVAWRSILDWIAADNQAFTVVENKFFVSMLKTFQPNNTPKTAKAVKQKEMIDLYDRQKELIKEPDFFSWNYCPLHHERMGAAGLAAADDSDGWKA